METSFVELPAGQSPEGEHVATALQWEPLLEITYDMIGTRFLSLYVAERMLQPLTFTPRMIKVLIKQVNIPVYIIYLYHGKLILIQLSIK